MGFKRDNEEIPILNYEPRWDSATLRDYFAIHSDLGDVKFENPEIAAQFMDTKTPESREEYLMLYAAVEARIRYMKADAMLAEREKSGE